MQMTPKQARFAELIAAGSGRAEAYKAVYSTDGMQPSTVSEEASRLVRHPKVAARLDLLKADAEAARRDALRGREEAILAQIEHEALTASSDAARIRALELLGKNAGLFVERVAVEAPERTVAEIEAELIARLTRLKIIEAEDAA